MLFSSPVLRWVNRFEFKRAQGQDGSKVVVTSGYTCVVTKGIDASSCCMKQRDQSFQNLWTWDMLNWASSLGEFSNSGQSFPS